MSGSDRIQVLDFPIALPAKCGICGFTGGTESGARKFVDFGLDIDWYGVVYFCSSCFRTAANALEYISVEQYAELVTENTELIGKLQRLEAENARLRAALDALDFLPRANVSGSEVTKSEPEKSDPNESGSTEPIAESGFTNLFEDDGIDILDLK